jgi:tripartite-type tricarboxylate transporter receptor subunit TctC
MMKIPRRNFLHLATGAAALPVVSRFARAQTYPSRPIRWIVGFPAGGSPDIVTRLMGQWLSDRLGQQLIIENRTGATGNIATEAVVRALPDGYTLLLATVVNAISASLYERLNFNFIRDIAPIVGIMKLPNIMVVIPSLPVKTVPEFIAYAKANPRKIHFASSGNGSTLHLSGEMFNMMAGVNMVHVPYRGGSPAAVTDMLGGQVQVMFDNIPNSIEHVRVGKLRALAVTSTTRSEVFPDIPTVGEFVPGFEAISWYGVGAPKNTPVEIIDKLNKEMNVGLTDSKLRGRLTDLGGSVLAGSPADFGKLIIDETEKWASVIQSVGIKAE